MKIKIVEYDVLRVLVTILVVIGHSSYFSIISDYGGIDYQFMIETSIIQHVINALIYVIYTFHMPCFIALSGAIFSLQRKQGKYMDFFPFLLNKCKRLLIPFFCVGLLYSIPLKLVTGYWEHSSNVVKDILIGQFFLQGNSYLWFLACLFLIFVIFWLYSHYEQHKEFRVCVDLIIIVFGVYHFSVSSQLLSNVLRYSIWFWCGYHFETIREKFNKHCNKITFVLSGLVFLFMIGLDFAFWRGNHRAGMGWKLLYSGYSVLIAVSGMILMYVISYILSQSRLTEMKLFQKINIASFGIYLYSDPLNYVILVVLAALWNHIAIPVEFLAASAFVFRIGGSFFGAMLITMILRKVKLRYIC